MQNNNSENNEQLAFMNSIDRKLKVGEEITGEVLSKSRDGILVSIIGYQTDGIIPCSEFTLKEEPSEFLEKIFVGDPITSKVIKLTNKDNLVVLSRLEYEKEEALEKLKEFYANNEIFELKISEIKENGIVGFYRGIRVFVPGSQIDTKFVNDKSEFLNKSIGVVLIELKLDRPYRIVASRRRILEVDEQKNKNEVWDKLDVGMVVSGEVKRFANFGAFVEIDGLDGLVHLSQISWDHVKNAQDYLKIGDIIDVKIIDIDRENEKLSLSIKQLIEEPWANIDEKYPIDSIALGKVVRISDFGAFIELESGVDGLVHISKISHNKVENIKDILKIGEEIKTRILSVDKEHKRIGLSIKDV